MASRGREGRDGRKQRRDLLLKFDVVFPGKIVGTSGGERFRGWKVGWFGKTTSVMMAADKHFAGTQSGEAPGRQAARGSFSLVLFFFLRLVSMAKVQRSHVGVSAVWFVEDF